MALLPVAEALGRILAGVAPTPAETVPVDEAGGRVLAADLAARLTQPPFAASAMDGYALSAADLASLPQRLTVIGQSAAGQGFSGALGRGEAVRIFTGAALPEGADTVVIQENAERDGDAVLIREGVEKGANVRGRGIDFTEGEMLLAAGRRLDAAALMLAAAMGHGELSVRKRPTVAILATGSELVSSRHAAGPRSDRLGEPGGSRGPRRRGRRLAPPPRHRARRRGRDRRAHR